MNGRGFNSYFLAAALMLMMPAVAFCGTPQVDLKRLTTEFDHWHTMASGDDYVYLDNTTWGAFFLFWGPVPESMPKDIDEAFVLEMVNRLRGESPAAFKAGSGEKVKIHGHKGCTVVGTAGDGDVSTCYTVFHCDKSDRIFLSQVDLHTACGTPVSVAERLGEAERTISCHGVNRRINNPKVPVKMNFPAINLAFYIPDGWRSDVFQENSTTEAGGIWTLPVSSDQKIYFARVEASAASAAAGSVLDGFRAELLKTGNGRTVELKPEADGQPVDQGGHFLLKGMVLVQDDTFSWDAGEHVFRLKLWEEGGRWNGLLYSILSRSEFEGKRVYLQPDETNFIDLEDRLAKAVDGFPAT